jgi:nitrogen regulatory protein PII
VIRIICIIRPHKLEAVKSAIAATGVSGLSVTEVRGTGNSEERATWFGGEQQVIALPIRSRIEVVAPEDLKDAIVEAIVEQARTGDDGDGKIFVEPILDAVRVRTEERGEEAI